MIINCLFNTRRMTEGPQNSRQPSLQQSRQSDAFFSLLFRHPIQILCHHTDSLTSVSSMWHFILSLPCLTAGCLEEFFLTNGSNLDLIKKPSYELNVIFFNWHTLLTFSIATHPGAIVNLVRKKNAVTGGICIQTC